MFNRVLGFLSSIFEKPFYYLFRSASQVGDKFADFEGLPQGGMWIHAPAVGEVQSALPFIRLVRESYPGMSVILSTGTTTGQEMAGVILKGMVDRCIFCPMDRGWIVSKALDRIRPRFYVTVETDTKPELMKELRKRGVRSFLLSGRAYDKIYYKRFLRNKRRWREALERYDAITLRNEQDRERFVALGVPEARLRVVGDCKIDALTLRKDDVDLEGLRRSILDDGRPIVLAGSTHEGEEQLLMEAFLGLRGRFPDARLIIAPRRPQRGEELLKLCRGMNGDVKVDLLSDVESGWDVLIVDSIGKLFGLYGVAKVSFVGGSLLPRGGHNIMEAAVWGRPFCQGDSYFNFLESSDYFISEGLCHVVSDVGQLEGFFAKRLESKDEGVGSDGKFVSEYGGACRESWVLFKGMLD